jgi:hypothetical protein
MPVKILQPMFRAAGGTWGRFHLRGHHALAAKQRDEARQATRVVRALPVPARGAGTTPHRFCVARHDRFIDVSERNLVLGEPTAKSVGVPKLAADALSGVMLRFELGGQGVHVGADEPVPHPAQDCGLSEVAFDQVFSCRPGWPDGEGSQDYAELQLWQARRYRRRKGLKTITRHNPELGITSLT